jgi:hypothetical protein
MNLHNRYRTRKPKYMAMFKHKQRILLRQPLPHDNYCLSATVLIQVNVVLPPLPPHAVLKTPGQYHLSPLSLNLLVTNHDSFGKLISVHHGTLNGISTWHAVGLYWIPGHAGVRGNETADGLARSGSASGFVGPEPALGVSKQNLSNKIGRWLGHQHQRRWHDLGNSQQEARELILGPSRGTRVKFLSFSREQSRVVTGLLTGH